LIFKKKSEKGKMRNPTQRDSTLLESNLLDCIAFGSDE